ncbi:RNA polymerase sigma factor [Arundinibacter roseus]|uniref:RNA polymerase sigma factor n=1 Tax=Arundinibacter roseus TaxID=2070510 RepID=UPI0014047D8B|nr:sigma-70 family RNA polymerase sigma factor [Arundinibacter roseus]
MNKKYIHPEKNAHFVKLWQRSVVGDKHAFCQLVEAHYQVLFNYGATLTTNHELLKDVLQELFIHLWEKRERIEIQYFTIYLLRALRNNLFLSFRENPTSSVTIEETAHEPTDESTIENLLIFQEIDSEKKQKIKRALASLPKRQKEIVFLKYYEGLTHEQIAGVMELNRQSVANLLHKALLSLRSGFDQLHYVLAFLFYW